jgi:VWFA-related protein
MLCDCSLHLLLLLSSVPFLCGQAAQISATSESTFKSKVSVVLVDVVVADRNGQPVTGLHTDNFEVFENDEAQTIASFEEHRGDTSAVVAKMVRLPPHFYSNAPVVEPTGALNVLLLDSLNTGFGDQAAVRRQMIQYLQAIDPGPRLAIFTLGARLRMVEGFTADPKQLLEALKHRHWGGTPQTSAMLRTPAEENLDKRILALMSEQNGGDTGATDAAIEALARFQAEMAATEAVSRMSTTLDALQELSRYLSAYPGRKNVIWFSGSFPRITFPSLRTDISEENGLAPKIKRTISMLAAAQIAVHPIAAGGLATQGLYEAQVAKRPMSFDRDKAPLEKVIAGSNEALSAESNDRYSNQKAAFDLADNTGGQAFVNTNGLRDAMAEVVRKGGYYYRLSYSPTDKRMLGRYRQIVVKFRKGYSTPPYSLAYRRGYFEENGKDLKSLPVETANFLQPLMSRGLPDATEIVYTVRLLRSSVQASPGTAIVGDNKELRGPVTRFGVDFVIPAGSLDFDIDADGTRHGRLQFALVAYDHAGTPMNWVVRSARTTLKPDTYSAVQKTGIQLHQEIDIPTGDGLFLRTGVYDLQSKKAGTLEIPMSSIATSVGSAEPQQPVAIAPPALVPSADSVSQAAPANEPPASPPEKAASVKAAASGPSAIQGISQPGSPSNVSEPNPADIPTYCASISGNVEHSAALANLCEFVLSMRNRLPNIICNRETKRYWTEYLRWQSSHFGEKKFDVVTAQVSYRDGQEYYDDIRLDGKPVTAESSLFPPSSLSGSWSVGEFATILAGAFLPSAKAEFRFEKEAKLGSTRALVFTVHVEKNNNRSYVLFADDKTWFPEYSGELWIDQNSFQLLRLRRNTAYMPQYPIRQVKTTIDYANVPLGDGTAAILPIHSGVMTCAPPPVGSNSNNCARSIVQFTNWHKFRATTNVVTTPAD